MKTEKKTFTINVADRPSYNIIQKEAEILGQFGYKGRLWIVHREWIYNRFGSWYTVSDYITGLAIGTSHITQKQAIYEAKKKLKSYTKAHIEEHIRNMAIKYNITKFNKI